MSNANPGEILPTVSPYNASGRDLLTFFLLSLVLSAPLWLIEGWIGIRLIPNLPLGALGGLGVVGAAGIMVLRSRGTAAIGPFLMRSFDFKRVKNPVWYLPAVLAMPTIMGLSFVAQRVSGVPIPLPEYSPAAFLIMFPIGFLAALTAELGWSGYASQALQARFGALGGALALGGAVAVWQFFPLWLAQRPLSFIAWWLLGTISARIILFWLLNNAGFSVFVAALFHSLQYLAWQPSPALASFYDPRSVGVISAALAVGVVILGGLRHLPHLRARPARSRRTFGIFTGMIVIMVAVIALGQSSGDEPVLDSVAAAELATGIKLESSMIDIGTIRLHVVQAGPKNGQPIVLLHGFPEFWFAWKDVIPPLVAAGYRVIVPDQRGCGDSEKPRDLAAYRVDYLANDIHRLIKTLGYQNAAVVAHDIGAFVAWNLAIAYPESLNHLVILGNFHPDVSKNLVSKEPKIDWYSSFFQIPYLPEWSARLFHWLVISKMLRDTAEPGAFPDEKLAQYRSIWNHDNSFSTMINWYRANNLPDKTNLSRRVHVPTLILLAPHDAFLPSDLIRASLDLVDKGQLVELPTGTHWVIQEHPEMIAAAVVAYLR